MDRQRTDRHLAETIMEQAARNHAQGKFRGVNLSNRQRRALTAEELETLDFYQAEAEAAERSELCDTMEWGEPSTPEIKWLRDQVLDLRRRVEELERK
jgi:hypothetical protein